MGFAAVAALIGIGCFGGTATADGTNSIADPTSRGGLALFDSAGRSVTSGTDLTQWARFVVAANAGPATAAPVVLSVARFHADEAPAAWPVTILAGGPGASPATATGAGLPAALLPLEGSVLDVGHSSLAAALGDMDGPTTVELRLSDSTRPGASYWSAYLVVDPTSQHWRLRPNDTAPITPALHAPQVVRDGNVVTVSGALASGDDGTRPTGWVELFDASQDRGAARYDPVTGAVTAKDVASTGPSAYHFVFTPADTATYTAADSATTSTAASPVPAEPADDPSDLSLEITVTPSPEATAYSATVITAEVRPSSVGGTVALRGDNFSAEVPVAGGRATVTTNAFGAGTHTISGTFTPSDTSAATVSGASAPFTLQAVGGAEADGSVTATVVAGPLTITTPFGPGRPLQLGDLGLAPDGSRLLATAHLGTAGNAARDGILITDTRAGDPGWSASLMASDLTSGTETISAQNLGFVGVHSMPLAGFGGGGLGTSERPVTTHDVPPSPLVEAPGSTGTAGLAGTPKVFASAAHGKGAVYVYGDLQLQAPTSAFTGQYTATLTFTVS